MFPTPGYYSVIQYCPDLSRLEAANIGVVLFCPAAGILDAKTSHGNDRIAKFFGRGSFDQQRMNVAKRALEESLRRNIADIRSLEDFQHFVDSRANDLLLTQPRPMKVFNPQTDLSKLYDDLVGGRARREAHRPIHPQLETFFNTLAESRRAVLNYPVRIPVLGRTLTVPYAYQNGKLNLVKPHVFSSDENPATNAAARLAVEGDLLRKHGLPDVGEVQLIVLPAFQANPANTPRVRENVLGLLREYNIRTIKGDEIPQFMDEVQQQAH